VARAALRKFRDELDMTTMLLILLVLVGVPAALAAVNRPGLVGRLWGRLVGAPTPDEVRAGVEENDELFRFARKSFEKPGPGARKGAAAEPVDPVASADVAALNVFVERAQIQLRRRVLWCGVGVGVCVALNVVVAAVALDWLTATPLATGAGGWQEVVRWGIQSVVLAALSFGLVYLFTTLARMLFREASQALEKRHAVGFGRLYVQMKVLGAADARRATRALTETELLRAFGWNPPVPPAAAKEAGERSFVLPAPAPSSVRPLRVRGNGAGEAEAAGAP
jgi:hypothetical protein